MTSVSHGKPYAGNPHVRFDEGASARGNLGGTLYSTLTGLRAGGDPQTPENLVNLVNPVKKTSLLVLPNHPAMVDPMLVGVAFWKTPLKPLSDELFFHTGIVAPHVLKTLGAVAVPDLRKHRTAKGATIARGLGDIVLKTLSDGGNVIFYPSGHIQTEPEHEDIGTRQLAYNICREMFHEGTDPSLAGDVGSIPAGVRIIGVRTRGLWGSIWSRKGRKTSPSFVPTFIKSVFLWFFWAPFVPRRRVTMHVEDLTDRVKEWSQLTRLDFNRKLEEWYNA